MIHGVLLPVLVLGAIAVAVPVLLERIVPETVAGLILNGAVSASVMTLVSALYFLWSYTRGDSRIAEMLSLAPGASALHFLKLGIGAGLIWAPVVVLTVSTAPRRWKENTW
ncbi:MAG: hypothetical protein ACU0DK_05535 [Pseudooceanicola sp.]